MIVASYRTPEAGAYCIAFPSLSTTEFEFDAEKAVVTALRVIDNFLTRHRDPRIRLILVESDPHSPVLDGFREYKKDPRFIVHVGDITTLKQQRLPCRYLVNPLSSWRLKVGPDLVNMAIHRAAGPSLLTKLEQFSQGDKKKIEHGIAYAVELFPSGWYIV
jgi:aprataxin